MNEQIPFPFSQIDGQSVRQTPWLTRVRKLPPWATLWHLLTVEAARLRMREASPLVQLLNGD